MTAKRYTKPRPVIPAGTRRKIKIEARHSCVVCKGRVTLEINHIDGNRENNDSENLVTICANCHGMFHSGQITVLELREYKKKAQEEDEKIDEEIAKLHQTLGQLLGSPEVSVSSDFGQLKLKYQSQLSGFADHLIFYQTFIYLIPEFFIDERGENTRSIVRELLNITPEEERAIVDHLQRTQAIQTVGGLLILQNVEDAKTALNELINSGRLDIQKLTEKFIIP